MRKLMGAVLLLGALPATLAAQQRYVTDVFTITVRTGRGNEFQIVRSVNSGTPVELLEATDDGYSRVRLRDGREGWVLTRFLSDEPPARERAQALEERLDEAAARTESLREELARAENQRSELEQRLEGIQTERDSLRSEVVELRELAERPRALEVENEKLQGRIERLDAENQALRERNSTLRDDRERIWFLTGAGVLLGGFLLGVVLPRIRWRRRSSWDSL